MSLPQRLYYPLDKAAKELGCDVSDLIHFAANGVISICAKISDYGEYFDDIIQGWEPNLLINEKKLINLIKKYYYINDGKFSPTENEYLLFKKEDVVDVKKGTFLYEDDINFDYVNSYVRLFGALCFTLERNNDEYELHDYELKLFRVEGLVNIPKKSFFHNEHEIISGNSIAVDYFDLPIDNSQFINGFFSDYNSEFGSNDEHGFIDADTEVLRKENIGNALKKEDGTISISVNNMYITRYELNRIKNSENTKAGVNSQIIHSDIFDSPKSRATGEKFIRYLISLLPEISEEDIDSLSPTRIKIILEQIAAKRDVPICDIHPQTLARYLGYEPGKR